MLFWETERWGLLKQSLEQPHSAAGELLREIRS